MGNEEEKIILQKSELISIELDKLIYYEGQLLNGKIKFEPSSETIIKEINIQLKVINCFYLSKKLINKSEEVFFKNKLNISNIFKANNNKKIKVPRGIHRIPFQFFLPSKIHPSFEFPYSSNNGFIRYILTAELITGNEKHLSEEYIYIKQRPFNKPSNTKYSDSKTIKDNSESTLNIYISTLDLKINEPIKIGIEINNEKCKYDSDKIKIKIFRTIIYKPINNEKKFERKIIEKIYPFNCLKENRMKKDYEDIILRDDDLKDIDFNDELNHYLGNINDINLLLPSFVNDFIQCEYRLEVSCLYDCYVNDKNLPTIILPIYAVHQSLLEYEGDMLIIEQQRNNLELVHQNNINEINVSDFKKNPYSPENNFGKKNNKNKFISGFPKPGIGTANPYANLKNDFPTKESIIRVENERKFNNIGNNQNGKQNNGNNFYNNTNNNMRNNNVNNFNNNMNNNNVNNFNNNIFKNNNKSGNNNGNNINNGQYDENGRKIGFIKYKNLFPK